MTAHEHPSAAAEALAAVPFLAPLSPVDLAKLAGVLEDQWFDAGSEVFEAGGRGDALFIMREGVAERRVAGSRIGLIEPPEVFGELALLTDQPRSSSVVALTPIRVWVLPQHRVHSLLRAEPELMFDLSRAIGRELAKARQALGELQRELEQWVTQRLDALTPQRRALVEAAALFEQPPVAVLTKLAGAPDVPDIAVLAELEAVAPLLQVTQGRRAVPAAMRQAILRHLDAHDRRGEVADRVFVAAKTLEREGDVSAALAAYRAIGADADVKRLDLEATAPVAPVNAEPVQSAPARKRKIDRLRLAGLVLAIVPLLFWSITPPSGLSVEGWRALLTLVSAAILFATEALPEAVIALALLACGSSVASCPRARRSTDLRRRHRCSCSPSLRSASRSAIPACSIAFARRARPQAGVVRTPLLDARARRYRRDADVTQCHQPRRAGGADGARGRRGPGLCRG